MSEDVGVDRNAAGMQAALVGLSTLADEARRLGLSQPEIEVINMITSGQAIAGAALHRLESRGAHYRSDAPATNPALDGQHSLLDGGADAWRYGALSDAFAPVVTGTRR
jgi:aspartate oxidase